MNKQTKDLVLGNITIKDETLAFIYKLNEAGIEALKEKLIRLHKKGYEFKDFDEYTMEEIRFIRKNEKKRHKTVQEILDEGERIYGNKVTVREDLLNKVPDKEDFDEIITAICKTEGVRRYQITNIYKKLLKEATCTIAYAKHNDFCTKYNEMYFRDEVDINKNEAYIDLVLKEFIEACSKVTNYKPWMKSIVNRYGDISAEDKAIKTYNRLFNSLMNGTWCYGYITFPFEDGEDKIIKKYGIKEKCLLNKEIIETINCLDEE